MLYTDESKIKEKVYQEYAEGDTELNALFFDFQVQMAEKDLLKIYAEIQNKINGDTVVRLSNVTKRGESVYGTEEELVPENAYEDIFTGNYKDFLEWFNCKEKETGLYHIMDYDEVDGLAGGYKLDFVL